MPYLDIHPTPLNSHTAAHLLRRATLGPTKQEITDFTGLTPTQAVNKLIQNIGLTLNPPPPVDYHENQPTGGKPFISLPYNIPRQSNFNVFVRFWWVGLMCQQNGNPSILEKLTVFWQNHFIVSQSVVGDYKKSYRFLTLLRNTGWKNFRDLIVSMTKDPGMLVFQNGRENQKGWPNENYARELQELFVVGQKDSNGNATYTETDVKEAARVLTGWQILSDANGDSTSTFTPSRHDTLNKTFSSHYGNKTIQGLNSSTAGDVELSELVDMLLAHPNSARFICQKLYRWYVNPNITQEVQNNVINPLATFFSSPENNWEILPVLEKLLKSDIFYDEQNRGAIIKAPTEFMIGMVRFFGQEVPDSTTDYVAFRKLMEFVHWNMGGLQLDLLNQPLVFGSIPYYQSGYSKNWINGNTLGIRGSHIDKFVHPNTEIRPGQWIGVDCLAWITSLQPNFSDVQGTPTIDCEVVYNAFSKNLFVFEMSADKKNFLIDTIMMRSLPRTTFIREMTNYRTAPSNINNRNGVMYRGQLLLRYMLRMAEYHIF